jgi:dipeptidyl aminopeptidase/acylaminoacyl peptidase
VATSGSYNKTLTPFGFQNERRSVWQAQDVYLKASPFFYADKIKHRCCWCTARTMPTRHRADPVAQALPGHPRQRRYHQLVMLPHEPHWYTALESNEQVVSDMLDWFDTYVKNA